MIRENSRRALPLRFASVVLALGLLTACATSGPISTTADTGSGSLIIGDTQVHVGGLFHDAPVSQDPIYGALEAGDWLVLEAPFGPEAQRILMLSAQARGVLAPPYRLRDRLSPLERTALADACRRTGCSADQFDRFAPWLVAFTLGVAPNESDTLPYRAEADLAELARSRGARVLYLENPSALVDALAGLSEADQLDLLRDILLNTSERARALEEMRRAWRRGDLSGVDALARTLNASNPRVQEAIVTHRSRQWANTVSSWLAHSSVTDDAPARIFVRIGAAHLAGPENFIENLANAAR